MGAEGYRCTREPDRDAAAGHGGGEAGRQGSVEGGLPMGGHHSARPGVDREKGAVQADAVPLQGVAARALAAHIFVPGDARLQRVDMHASS